MIQEVVSYDTPEAINLTPFSHSLKPQANKHKLLHHFIKDKNATDRCTECMQYNETFTYSKTSVKSHHHSN